MGDEKREEVSTYERGEGAHTEASACSASKERPGAGTAGASFELCSRSDATQQSLPSEIFTLSHRVIGTACHSCLTQHACHSCLTQHARQRRLLPSLSSRPFTLASARLGRMRRAPPGQSARPRVRTLPASAALCAMDRMNNHLATLSSRDGYDAMLKNMMVVLSSTMRTTPLSLHVGAMAQTGALGQHGFGHGPNEQ